MFFIGISICVIIAVVVCTVILSKKDNYNQLNNNSIKPRIFAAIAITISLISFGFMIAALILYFVEPPVGEETTYSFASFIIGIAIAVFSLLFYTIDTIFLIIKAFKGIDSKYNAILSFMILIALPIIILLLRNCVFYTWLLWYAYYVVIIAVELIPLVKLLKNNRETNKI